MMDALLKIKHQISNTNRITAEWSTYLMSLLLKQFQKAITEGKVATAPFEFQIQMGQPTQLARGKERGT